MREQEREKEREIAGSPGSAPEDDVMEYDFTMQCHHCPPLLPLPPSPHPFLSFSFALSLSTHPNREGAASLIRARMIDKERERGREKVGWKKRTKTTTMEAKLTLPCAKVAATV